MPIPPVPWEITGTSSIALVPESPPGYRIERRFFQKKDRVVVRTGFAYLSRGDFYSNPGVGLDVAWYPEEAFGVDLLSATVFLSELTPTAAALRRSTGLLPDSEKPIVRLTTGGRFAFAYGKLLLEELDAVIHMDASASLHLGVLVTDEAANLGGDLGLSFQAAAFERWLVWVEAGWFVSYEDRTTTSFASGPLATFGVGLLL